MSDFLFENPALESVSAGSRYLPENEEVKEEEICLFSFLLFVSTYRVPCNRRSHVWRRTIADNDEEMTQENGYG